MERYLLDLVPLSNTSMSPFQRLRSFSWTKHLDKESNISFITQIELLVWTPPKPDDLKIYQEFVAQSKVLHINDAIIERTIFIRKKTKIKVPDAIIAASATVYGYTLISDNDKDFDRVLALDIGLRYLNPMKM